MTIRHGHNYIKTYLVKFNVITLSVKHTKYKWLLVDYSNFLH